MAAAGWEKQKTQSFQHRAELLSIPKRNHGALEERSKCKTHTGLANLVHSHYPPPGQASPAAVSYMQIERECRSSYLRKIANTSDNRIVIKRNRLERHEAAKRKFSGG